MQFGDSRLPPKFWAKLERCHFTGCWLWVGAMNKNGYGSHGRRAPHSGSMLTHRYTYETEFGALPPGHELDHFVCQVRRCGNPHHLEAVTHTENIRRGKAKKTHCVRGHELAGDNLMPCNGGDGMRCVTCYRIASEERSEQKRAATKARGPLPKKPKKTEGTCGNGHVMRFNGRRLVCHECHRVYRKAA